MALYLNARTDVFLLDIGEPAGRVGETLRRARAFLDAGADGIFVPAVVDAPTVAELVGRDSGAAQHAERGRAAEPRRSCGRSACGG